MKAGFAPFVKTKDRQRKTNKQGNVFDVDEGVTEKNRERQKDRAGQESGGRSGPFPEKRVVNIRENKDQDRCDSMPRRNGIQPAEAVAEDPFKNFREHEEKSTVDLKGQGELVFKGGLAP